MRASAVNNRTWPLPTIIAGLALIFGVPLLFSLAPTQVIWSEAEQEKLSKAAADFHASTFQLPAHKSAKNSPPAYDPVAAKKRYEDAKGAYEAQKARLDSARSRPAWIAWILRAVGILLALIGVVGHLTAQSSPAQAKESAKSSMAVP